MKVHDYEPSLNNMYEDVPTAKNQRPTSPKREPHFRNSTLTLTKDPSNTFRWTSSRTCRKATNTTASLQSSTRNAPKLLNSFLATKQSTDQGLHDSTSIT